MELNENGIETVNYAEPGLGMKNRSVFFQHHQPSAFDVPYHFHPSIEINFLTGCDMLYSIGGREVWIKDRVLTVFWAANPHKPLRVTEDGWITNAYVSLTTFMSWSLPSDFVVALLRGGVLSAKKQEKIDVELARFWAAEIDTTSAERTKLHAMEIRSRMNRMALDGWDTELESSINDASRPVKQSAMQQFERMLRFSSQNFSRPLKIEEIAEAGGVNVNRALELFKLVLGQTIKGHVTDLRIYHAQMLLSETQDKILSIAMDCGYASQSSFYEAFRSQTGMPPAEYRKKSEREYF